jgi:predicted secreted Zn-dependent protease
MLAFGHHEDRTPTHGFEPTREAAMAAFAKSWRREAPPRNGLSKEESKDAMLRIAQDYERLAKRAEHRAAGRLPNWMKH